MNQVVVLVMLVALCVGCTNRHGKLIEELNKLPNTKVNSILSAQVIDTICSLEYSDNDICMTLEMGSVIDDTKQEMFLITNATVSEAYLLKTLEITDDPMTTGGAAHCLDRIASKQGVSLARSRLDKIRRTRSSYSKGEQFALRRLHDYVNDHQGNRQK